jgi:hypothetical protein
MTSPITPPVIDKTSVDIDFSGGLNEAIREGSLDWSKYLKRAENVTFEEPGVIKVRPGVVYANGLDDGDSNYSPIVRMLPTTYGPCGIGSYTGGSIGTTNRLYHYNFAQPSVVKKSIMSEFGVQVTPMGSVASAAGGGRILGTGYTSDYKILLTSVGWFVGTATLNITDTASGNLVRSYKIPAQNSDTTIHVMAMVSDRYIHVYSGVTSGGDTVMRQFDLQDLDATLPASVAVSNPDAPIGAVAYLGGSAVVMANSWLSRFNTVPAETHTGVPPLLATVGGLDTDGVDLYVSGVNSTPRKVLHVLDSDLLGTRIVIGTDTDVLATDMVRVAVGSTGIWVGHCMFITYHSDTDWPVAQVDFVGAADTDFTRVQNMPCWGEGSVPFYYPATEHFYVHLNKNVRTSGYLVSSVPTSDSVTGAAVLVDLFSGSWGDNPTAFRAAAVLDAYTDTNVNGDTGAHDITTYRPHVGSTFVALGGVSKSTLVGVSYEHRLLTYNDLSVVSSSVDTFSGGITSSYDGLCVSEFGWVDTPCVSGEPDGAGTLAAGSYNYTAIYEFKDNAGRSHFSRCARICSVVTSTTGDIDLTVSIPTVTNHSNHHFNDPDISTANDASIHLYRTVSGGTQYHLHTVSPISTAANSISITDSTADAVLESQPLLFRQPGTFGTALDRYHALSSSHVLRMKDRVFYCRGNDIFYSSFAVEGEAPWFSPGFKITVASGDGPIIGLGRIDATLVALKRSSVHVIEGDGPPENGGSGQEFSQPKQVTAEFGCIDPRSIVSTPVGVMYRSEEGIELLDRSLKVSFIGERVYRTVDAYPLTGGGDFDRVSGRVMWIVVDNDGNSRAVVYAITSNTWSVYTYSVTMHDVAWVKDKLWFGMEDGFMWEQGNLDDTTFIETTLETGWVRSTSKQERIRCECLQYLATRVEDCNVVVESAYDYDTNYSHQHTFPAAITTGTEVVQLQAEPPKELVQAISFRIQHTGSASPGQGRQFDIFGLTLRLGLKGGGVKIPATHRGALE